MSGVQVLGDDWDDGDGGNDLPDELGWLPGELGEPRDLLSVGGLHLRLLRSLVHPNGVLVTLKVRSLAGTSDVDDPTRLLSEAVALDDVRRRRLADEVLSFREPELGGPRLARRDPVTGEGWPAVPWAQGGSTDSRGGLWSLPECTLNFKLSCNPYFLMPKAITARSSENSFSNCCTLPT